MKKTRFILPLLSAALLLGACSSVNPLSDLLNNQDINYRYSGDVEEPEQKTIYYVDETINVKAKDIVYGDKVYSCVDFYVVYPDGAQKGGSKVKLSQAGEYTIVYIATEDGMVIKASEKIKAYKKAYDVGKDSSSTSFVNKIICDNKNPTSGIQTYLAEGDTWTYNQAIDISKADLNTPIIKYYTRQSSELAEHVSVDVASTIIRLTDFYDPSIYVDIYNTYNETNESTHRMQPYVLAGCNGQPLSGIDLTNRSTKTISYEGVTYYLHNNNKWGSCLDTVPGTTGIYGTKYNPDIANSDNRGFSVYFDYSKLAISVKHNLMHLVTDLDEPAIYSSNLFGGFTTGEVILSMRCETYNEALGFFEIAEIFGKKGDELNSQYAFDENAPRINLSNEADNFYIAHNEPFKVFDAYAVDPNLVGGVTTQVYYDYGTANQRFVPVANGYFTPTSIGKYSIVYTAKDTYGNIATRVVNCNSIRASGNEIVSLSFNPTLQADAGTNVTFEAPVVTSYNDGTYYRIKAINDENGYETTLGDDLSLFLKYAGTYRIIVEYGDISCSKNKEYSFMSLPSDNAYLENVTLPRYLLKDTHMTIDDNRIVLVDQTKPHYESPTVQVRVDDELSYRSEDINPKDFLVDASSKVQFKYSYKGKTIYESEDIPVVDVDYFGNCEFDKYFQGDLSTSLNGDGVSFNSDEVGEDAKTTFINPLSFSLFRSEIIFDSKLRYSSIDLVMEDYYGNLEPFNLSFFYNGNVLCYIYQGIKGEIGVVDYVSLSYDAHAKTLSFGSGVTMELDNLFIADKVYLSFIVRDLKKDEGSSNKIFTVKSINNQIISNLASGGDYNPPQISYTSLKGQRNINEVITVKRSFACDVLSPYYSKTHYMMVTYAKSIEESKYEPITSIDGVTLDGRQDLNRDYDVLLAKKGVYRVTYYYQDQNYQTVSITETIYVEDNEAPEISVNGANNKTIDIVSLGDEVKIRDYTVKDESEVTVSIFAITPQNTIIRIENGKFTPEYKGDYHIVYYAVDANNNIASASYIVRVK